ncbi:hypothetical protein LXL04_007203 [Taraxacum kok-saghyz]
MQSQVISSGEADSRRFSLLKTFVILSFEHVNDPVEVYGREEDRCLCFYAATIVSLFETDAEVRFADLKTEDNKPIIEKVGLQYLRPRPVNFSLDFKCGDVINVWIKDRWWLGKFVTNVRRSQAVCLIFKAGREETFFLPYPTLPSNRSNRTNHPLYTTIDSDVNLVSSEAPQFQKQIYDENE